MDITKIQKALEKLLNEVHLAEQKGYQYARVPLTPEVVKLIPKIQSGQLANYVKLKNTSGVFRCFTETLPDSCATLSSAWTNFQIQLEGLNGQARSNPNVSKQN
jgi:hypothetical protein